MYGKYENMKWREEEENSLNRALCCYGKTKLGELACLKQDWQCLCCTAENNQIANRKLIHQRRNQEREQRDNQERNRKTRTEKALKGVSLRREQPTVLKVSTEFKKDEHGSRRLGNIFMEEVDKLISF